MKFRSPWLFVSAVLAVALAVVLVVSLRGRTAPPTAPSSSAPGLVDYLPVGRHTHTVIAGIVQGVATSQKWPPIETEHHFVWSWTVEYDTKVLAKDGKRVRIERTFTHVGEFLRYSRDDIHIKLPRIPLVGSIGKFLFKRLEQSDPWVYWTIETARQFDPDGEKLRAAAVKLAETLHLTLPPEDGLIPSELKDFFDQVQGLTVEITYVEGMGITDVKPTSPSSISDDVRTWIERSAAITHARELVPNPRALGIPWTVDVSKLGMLLEPGSATSLRGELRLQRAGPDEKTPRGMTRMTGAEGEIVISANQDRAEVQGRFWPETVEFIFDPGHLIIGNGYLRGTGQYEFTSPHDLLFEAHLRARPEVMVQFWTGVLD